MVELTNQIFDSLTVEKTFKKGTCIFREGEAAGGIYQILEGRVMIFKEDNNLDRRIILSIAYPHELFGLLDFFRNKEDRRCNAIAMDHLILQFIPNSEFEKYSSSSAKISFAVIKFLIMNYELCWDRICRLNGDDITLKVYGALRNLAIGKGIKTDAGIFLKGIRHQELADYIGVSRNSVTTAMNNFRKKGLIDYNRNHLLFKL